MIVTAAAKSFALPPTATYADRRILWLPASPEDADGRLGTLVVVLTHRRGGRVERDRYAVEEEGPAVGVLGRSFLLLNLDDPDQDDVYRVAIGYPVDRCSCTAGCVKRYGCKHSAGLRELIVRKSL